MDIITKTERFYGRVEWIDTAKGIGIFLVVFGHLLTMQQMPRIYIYAFHMPLFFMLSGVFAKTDVSFKKYFIKNLKTLYVPYIVFAFVDFLVLVFKAINIGENTGTEIARLLKNFFLSALLYQKTYYDVPTWFLGSLFLIRIICYFIDRIKPQYIAVPICFVIIFLIRNSYFNDLYTSNKLINNIYTATICPLAFYILGSLLKQKFMTADKFVNEHKGISIILAIVLSVIFAFTAKNNDNGIDYLVDLATMAFGKNILLFIINSLIGITISIIISVFLSQVKFIKKILIYYGRNTLPIIITHWYFAKNLNIGILNKLNKMDLLYKPYYEIITFVIIMLLMVPVIWIFNNYLYFIIGKSRPEKRKKAK